MIKDFIEYTQNNKTEINVVCGDKDTIDNFIWITTMYSQLHNKTFNFTGYMNENGKFEYDSIELEQVEYLLFNDCNDTALLQGLTINTALIDSYHISTEFNKHLKERTSNGKIFEV